MLVCVLLLALVKYMLRSHFTQNFFLMYFLEAKNPYFATKNCWKSSYICVFILSKKQHNWFYKNLYNSGMFGRIKLRDPSLKCSFNALSISFQYTLLFQWTNFNLKCLVKNVNKLIPISKSRFFSECHLLNLKSETIVTRNGTIVWKDGPNRPFSLYSLSSENV